jgi:hypothetical protein
MEWLHNVHILINKTYYQLKRYEYHWYSYDGHSLVTNMKRKSAESLGTAASWRIFSGFPQSPPPPTTRFSPAHKKH